MTRADELRWFHDEAPTWQWTWARTFADTAPHSYVIKGKTLDPEPYERAYMLSMAAGVPRKFYRRINIELECPDLTMLYGPRGRREEITGFKFWPMAHQRSLSKAFNVAPLGLHYGVQDAPDTTTAEDSPFDLEAGDWHDLYEEYRDGRIERAAWRMLCEDGRAVGRVLDVGPRLGFAQACRIVDAGTDYTAVEPSQGLLNLLLRRNPWVRNVVPESPDVFVGTGRGAGFDTVLALFGTASYLRPETVEALAWGNEAVFLMFYADDGGRDFFGDRRLPAWAQESFRAAASIPGAQVAPLENFLVVRTG